MLEWEGIHTGEEGWPRAGSESPSAVMKAVSMWEEGKGNNEKVVT